MEKPLKGTEFEVFSYVFLNGVRISTVVLNRVPNGGPRARREWLRGEICE